MANLKNQKNTRICPVCGTKLSEAATRCLVCGTQLNTTAAVTKTGSTQPKRTANEIRISLPLAIILGLVIVALAGLLAFFVIKGAAPTSEITVVDTPT